MMHRLIISSPDKILYPSDNFSKRMVLDYYEKVADFMLPFIHNRPLTTQRFPHGIDKSAVTFYQKNVPAYFPDWIGRLEVQNKSDERITTYAICNGVDQLLYLVNEYCLVFHGWLSVAEHLNFPDRLIIDLDPGERSFAELKRVAVDLRDMLSKEGLTSFVMLTGSRGVHLVLPIDSQKPFEDVRNFIHELLIIFQREHHRATTLEMHIKDRGGKIFLDYLRNAYGQTAIVPFSLRPYLHAPIAWPVSWDEFIDEVQTSQAYTLNSLPAVIPSLEKIWPSFFSVHNLINYKE